MGNHHSKSSSTNNSSDDTSSHVCDQPGFDTSPTSPMVGSLDFHHLNIIICGACAAFSTIMLVALMFRHATHFSKPHEQANILRICMFIPIYAIGSFIEVCAPTAYVYLQPWLEVAQAFALASFFILICRFLSSETNERRDVFLAPMKVMQKKSGSSTGKAVAAYRKTWILIFQYPIISILMAIFTTIAQGADKYCFGSHKVYFASLWLEIIEKVSMIIAVIAVLKTYAQLKVELRPHRAIQKLFAFKLLIGLQFLQQIIYMILTRISPSPLEPTDKLSYTDLEIGIPLLLVSCELVIFSIFFHFAYSVTPYRLTSYSHKPLSPIASDDHADESESYHGGPLGIRAWFSMLNPAEFISAFMFTFSIRKEVTASGHGSDQASPLNPYPTSYQQPIQTQQPQLYEPYIQPGQTQQQQQQYGSYEQYGIHPEHAPPHYGN